MMIDYLEPFFHRKLFVLLWESYLALVKVCRNIIPLFYMDEYIYVYYQGFCIQNVMALINTTGW